MAEVILQATFLIGMINKDQSLKSALEVNQGLGEELVRLRSELASMKASIPATTPEAEPVD